MGGSFLGRPSGSHQFKAGVDVIGSWRFVTFFNNFAGTYTFAQGAKFPFNASDPATFPFQFTQTFGGSGLNFKDAMVGVFAQDDWEVRRGLTLNLGVRWDKDSLFQGDNNNFAPRVGFAWNVGGDAKTVVRGNTRHLLRHARVVADQPRVEHRPGRSDDDRPAAGRSAVPDVSRTG